MYLAKQKQIERQALNVNLKDHKGFGLTKTGQVRKGFHRLKDGRIISLKQLREAIEAKTPKRPDLNNINVVDPETVKNNSSQD